VRILAVCGMGFGSSMVLRMTIESVLQEAGIQASVATSDIGSAASEAADVVVTSSELAPLLSNKEVPVVEIRNYVDKQEMKEKLLAVMPK
jgi:PTS system ascorbate-specific IIB component